MPLLEAFLALALTMLSLATISTIVIEIAHRVVGVRSKDLKKMLELFFENELKKYAKKKDENKKDEQERVQEIKDSVIAKLMENPLVPHDSQAAGVMKKLPHPKKYLKKLTSLPAEDLFKRLAGTEVGKEIMTEGEDKAKRIVKNLSQKFDEYENAATDFFKRRAQYYSLLAGLFVAFVLNVDALALFKAYVNNPEARAAAVAQSESISSNFEQITKQLEEIEAKKEDTNDDVDTLNAIKKDVESINTRFESLQGTGVPIGYTRKVAPATIWTSDSGYTFGWKMVLSIPWFVRVFFSGLLVGLGGPFWFNIVTNLMKLLGRGGAPGQQAETGKGAPQTPVDPVQRQQDIFISSAEAAKTSIASSSSSSGGGGSTSESD